MPNVSNDAFRLACLLERAGAMAAGRAMTDKAISMNLGIDIRYVIDLACELANSDVAVLAGANGRYISTDVAEIERYARNLHSRAKSIHERASHYTNLASRMRQGMNVEPGGQRRLF